MENELRKQLLADVRRVVVKVGSAALCDTRGRFSEARVRALSASIADLVKDGRKVVLVTSGAIAAGMSEIGLQERPDDMARLQALAALGQGRLMKLYKRFLRKSGLVAGQILVTRQTFENRAGYLNVKRTVAAIENYGGVVIINENDSVSADEIRLGDNDLLSAMVANLVGAELLVLLTVVDGLLDREGRVVSLVDDIDSALGMVRSRKSRLGTGGMRTKLEAAKMMVQSGEAAVIANGRARGILARVLAGEGAGTLFVSSRKRMRGKKRWIRFAGRVRGVIVVDDGARKAMCESGKSLLASGVRGVRGDFGAGDLVAIAEDGGKEFARGIARFSSADVQKTRGLKSHEVGKELGRGAGGVVVHRDNLVLVE